MKIVKILNNCVVLAEANGQEYVVMGNALGFHYKKGQELLESDIDKIFVLSAHEEVTQLQQLLTEISEDILLITLHLIERAKTELRCEFNTSLALALMDHLNYAFRRFEEGMKTSNALYFEIQKFYPKEFALGEYALTYIEEQKGIRLWPQEAANIALHFVNAQNNAGSMQDTLVSIDMIRDILRLIQLHYKITFDISDLNYHRLVTHLSYFIQRMLQNKGYQEEDDFLYQSVIVKYPKEMECALKIAEYIRVMLGCEATLDELAYLSIHLHRVLQRKE